LSKSIAIEPGLLELLQKVAGVRFFLRHSVVADCLLLWSKVQLQKVEDLWPAVVLVDIKPPSQKAVNFMASLEFSQPVSA